MPTETAQLMERHQRGELHCGNCAAWKQTIENVGECWSADRLDGDLTKGPVSRTFSYDFCEAWYEKQAVKLRHPVNWKYIRYCAVRSLFECRHISMEKALDLLAEKHSTKEMAVVHNAIEMCWSKTYKPSRIVAALTPKQARKGT